MQFNIFQSHISKIQAEKLKGFHAHKLMAPQERIEQLLAVKNQSQAKKAGVLLLLYPKEGQTHLVFIKRADYDGTHGGQIAFPGGKFEGTDKDMAHTALRETHEEIGIEPSQINIIKTLSTLFVPPSNFIVHPFLGITNQTIIFKPDAKEVAAIIEVPLIELLRNEAVTNKVLTTSYANSIEVPVFQYKGQIIWGATAMILSELKCLLNDVFDEFY